MMTSWFDRLGEIMAPRSGVFKKEFWALLKGGLFEKALALLRHETSKKKRDPFFLEVINVVDEATGMAPLHIACAAGQMELVVELLSMDADIAVLGINGNNALHFAALNERKGIIEILIRSGADLSVPNQCGLLPVELCKTAAVAELFLRDRSNLFSPIAQTRTLLSDYIQQIGENAVPALPLSPRTESGHSIPNHTVLPRTMQVNTPMDAPAQMDDEYQRSLDEEDMQRAVLHAASETAKAYTANKYDFEAKRLVFQSCQKLNEVRLRKLLAYDPSLSMSRCTNLSNGTYQMDGQTPLHVAAAANNLPTLKILLELGADATLWVRDLQGRCPLHLAAENGHIEMCEFLRGRMKLEDARRRDPVGPDAPTDLNGTTPLGWATFRAKGKPKAGMQASLFRPGDPTILPKSPVRDRGGTSPWKGATPLSSSSSPSVSSTSFAEGGGNIVYAFSEASGWTPGMEDRILAACPVQGMPAWSLFGVCDGHAGEFSSEFLSQILPSLVAKEAAALSQRMGDASDPTPMALQTLLLSVCQQAEQLLKSHPRMIVERKKDNSVACLDSSGSTVTLALITPRLVAVANVGDSRAVLGQCSTSPSGNAGLEVVGLSRDHKPNIPEEIARVRAAGALALPIRRPLTIEEQEEGQGQGHGQGQVDVVDDFTAAYEISDPAHTRAKLRMSRSFGDFCLKAIIAVPEIKIHTRGVSDRFVVLACDGVWDVMSNQEAVEFVASVLLMPSQASSMVGNGIVMAFNPTQERIAEACDALLQEVLARGSVDNISVLVVVLGPPPVVTAVAAVANIATGSTDTSTDTSAASLAHMVMGSPPLRPTLVGEAHHGAATRPLVSVSMLPTPVPVDKEEVQLTPSPTVDPNAVRRHLNFSDPL